MEQSFKNHNRLYALIADIIDTPEIRDLLFGVGNAWLKNWSRSGILKKAVGKPMGWVLSKTLDLGKAEELPSVFGKPEHIETVVNEIPQLLHSMAGIMLSVVRAVESLPNDRKKAMLDRLFSGFPAKPDGEVTKSIIRIIEEVYQGDPTFFSSLTTPLVERWVAQTDFGELRHLFDLTKKDIEALISGVINSFFDYPAKLVTTLSVAPEAANLGLSVIDTLLGHFNAMPADVFADLLLAMARQIDTRTAGKIFRKINEVIRQLHTGSTLIGEMDAPQFTSDLREKIVDFMDEIDPELTIKARNALIDGRETVLTSLIEAAEARPGLLNLWLSQLSSRWNSDIRLFKLKIQVIETLSEDDAVSALSAGLSNWNAYDLAEAVNAISRMMNRMRTLNPDIIQELVTEFVNSIDRYELEETLDWALRDLGKAVRPVFRTAAPFVVRELCGFFRPEEEDDGYDNAMEKAREDLSRLFAVKEMNGGLKS